MEGLSSVLARALLISVVVSALVFTRSTPAGASGNSITTPDTVGAVGYDASLTLDASGNPVVAYKDEAGTLKVMHCNDPNCSGGNESISSPDMVGLPGYGLSLVLDSSGNPVVSYANYDSGAPGGDYSDLKIMHCNDPNCVGGNESVTSPDTAGVVGWGSSIELDSLGRPVVAYFSFLDNDLKVLRCGNANCTSTNSITTVDPVVQDNISLELDSAGNPVVSYQNAAEDLKVVHCGNPTCTSGNVIRTPDAFAANGVGNYTSLALDSANRPIVAHYDVTAGDLRILHCGESTCLTGNKKTTPDTGGDVGLYPSLVLDTAGNPVISYVDKANAKLRVLHCDNPSCETDGGESIAIVDSVGTAGKPTPTYHHPTSIALDSSGNPVVAYFDDTNDDLKVLHCGNPSCKGIVVGGLSELAWTTDAGFEARFGVAISIGAATAMLALTAGAMWVLRWRRTRR